MSHFDRLALALLILLAAGVHAGPAAAQPAPAVDDARLAAAPAGEWLTYGRDYAETRYSPLSQINTGNVQRLGLAWTLDIEAAPGGGLQATPLVADGVMYFSAGLNNVLAIDAATGALKWRWDPGLAGGPQAPRGGPNRGVALYDGKVYIGLVDGRLVALDAQTGQPVWSRQTTPYGVREYNITGAPRVVNGKIIIGNGGAEFHGVRGYVTAYDARTGEQVWRFYTVPGDPSLGFESPAMEMAAETWAGEWWKYGGGGTAWDSFSFDPEANLLYIGTGNGAPWSHFWRSDGIGDNLFVNSVVAVDADTGEYVWHYQTVPADNWDYTTTMNLILADIVIDGRKRQVLMTANKAGFFYVIDRLTGELLSAKPFAVVTWATHVDMETGRPVETSFARYDTIGAWISPGGSAWGAHNWYPMSWHPRTGLAYVPGQNTANHYRLDPDYEPVLGQFSTGTLRNIPPDAPARPTFDPPGFLLARDPVTQDDRWRIPLETVRNGGTLTSGENLLFSLRRDGWINAHDATTGEVLWEYRIGSSPVSPITYEVGGTQYVAVLTNANDLPGRLWTFVLDGTAASPIGPQ
jgi:PQQ-dependent dehydrogenase (methanol/ethanol family)